MPYFHKGIVFVHMGLECRQNFFKTLEIMETKGSMCKCCGIINRYFLSMFVILEVGTAQLSLPFKAGTFLWVNADYSTGKCTY